MAVADELVTILGVDIAKNAIAKIESFKNGIDSVKNTLLGLSVVITGAAATMGLMVKGAADEAAELQKLSDKTGVSTDALQEWGYAATKVGGDSKALHGDLQALQEKFMGTGKDAEKTLLSLADRMKGMSGSQAQNLGKGWGLSDDTIALLRKGRDGIEDLRKEAHKLGGVIPADSIKRAADFKKQLAELQFAFHGLTSQVAIAMIPAMSKAAELSKGWMESNREWLSLRIGQLMDGIVTGFNSFCDVLKKLKEEYLDPLFKKLKPFTEKFKDIDVVARLVRGGLMALLVIFAPFLVKFALLGGLVFIVIAAMDDLYQSITTGEGAFADMARAVKRFYEENEILAKGVLYTVGTFAAFKVAMAIESALGAVTGGIKGLTSNFGKLNKVMKANIFILLASMAIAAIQLIYEHWDEISEYFSDLWDEVKEYFPDFGKWAEDSVKTITGIWEGLRGFFKGLWEDIKGYMPDVGAWGGKIKGLFGFGEEQQAASKPSTIPVGGQPAAVRLPSPRGAQGTQYTDNRTQNFNVATSNPQQAAEAAAALSSGQPVGTPGVAAPAM